MDGSSAASTQQTAAAGNYAATQVVNLHFTSPEMLPQMPWEMTLEERRANSKDPRIMKQVATERQWDNTQVKGLWSQLREVALPVKDYMITAEEFANFIVSRGITSQHFITSLLELFDPRRTGLYNCLAICKIFDMALTTEPYVTQFTQHCFDTFDRVPCSETINKRLILNTKLQNPLVVTGKKGSPKKLKLTTTQMRSGANYGAVEGLKHFITEGVLMETKDPNEISYDEFRAAFLNSNHTEWVSHFTVTFFECAVKYFNPPHGVAPTIPLRWLNETAPIPSQEDTLYDADSVLLAEIEQLGMDPMSPPKKSKKSGGAKSSKKK